MARPRKRRCIGLVPGYQLFKPAGVPASALNVVALELDEFEALRLTDFLGLHQEEAAAKMRISRPTFGRILEEAHRKVATALVSGQALKIAEKGEHMVVIPKRTFICSDCGHNWQVPYGTGRPASCPACSSRNFHRSPEERGPCGGGGLGRGRCRGWRRARIQAQSEEK